MYESADAVSSAWATSESRAWYGTGTSDYKSIGLDFGFRQILPHLEARGAVLRRSHDRRGLHRPNQHHAPAPQGNLVFNQTDFYDATGAFTWSLNAGVVFKVAKQADLTAQIGLRHVGGLSEVDQFAGTGLETINADSARLTFPIVVGARFRF